MVVTNLDIALVLQLIILQMLEEQLISAKSFGQTHQLIVIPVAIEDRLGSDIVLTEK
jgi:hypothetical protein